MFHIKTMTKLFQFLLLSVIVLGCSVKQDVVVNHTNPKIYYQGRIVQNKETGTELFWPGTSITIEFEGTEIYALLQDEKGENFYNVIVDNKVVKVLNPNSKKEKYPLATGLSQGKHVLQLFRKTEFTNGKTTFFNFSIHKNAKLLSVEPKKRKIEFYGNSISAGHGIDDLEGKDRGEAQFYNNYLAYSALTARHYDADYNCICKGGIGLMISWFPYTMPDIYDKINPLDKNSFWDFSKKTPDIVVVNLFQNDSWLVKKPNSEMFKAAFGTTEPTKEYIINAYKTFILSIRKHYPNAEIICALGNMDVTKVSSPWPSYVQEAKSQLNDPKIHTLFFPYKETKGHPNRLEHEDMSKLLIKYIDENIKW
jgi:Carbohydrate esterase 2 N-terminal